jgi:16S rRNA (uracil1498-N3)-methyltransferase
VADAPIPLPDPVAHHALRVLRLRQGDPLVLFDGGGGEFHGRFQADARGNAAAVLEAFDAVEREPAIALTLVQGLCAHEKTDWLLEKCVEAGVHEIVLVATERSVVRLDEDRASRRLARWRDIVSAACCQCGRNRLPRVRLATSLRAALEVPPGIDRRILDPDASLGFGNPAPAGLALAVGPEGGFTPEEIALARALDYRATRFGPRVLRAETAGLLAVAAALALGGEFS